jgi:predicted nucleic acid-binding protein
VRRGIIVDTDVTIDFLHGEGQAIGFFKARSDTLRFSAVTVAEIHSGVRGKREEGEVERLFSVFPVVVVTTEIAREAGRLVRKYRPSHRLVLLLVAKAGGITPPSLQNHGVGSTK